LIINKKCIILLLIIFSFSYSKSLLRKDYLDGYTEFDITDSEKIVAVLPFHGDDGGSASDYTRLYLGMYTDLDIIERGELDKIIDEQDLYHEQEIGEQDLYHEQDFYHDRLNPEIRAKIKELFGADIIVLGKVWSKYHVSLINFVLPWNWKDIIIEHWFIRIRMVNADTGQIHSSYYLRDGDGIVSLGLNEYYLSESIEKIILRMVEDYNNIK